MRDITQDCTKDSRKLNNHKRPSLEFDNGGSDEKDKQPPVTECMRHGVVAL